MCYQPIGVEDIFDFTVPSFRNYCTQGAVHHNTYGGAAEHAMHLTGDYPSWWEGREFPKAPRMWVASDTTEMTVAGVQGYMMGRFEDGWGTGSIPKDRIVEQRKKQHGVANALEYVIVRHGGGGDVQAGQSYCGFKSYDQGREKFQAETLDIVWLDEEPPEDIYFEALTRISTTGGLCSLTFTPLRGMSRVVVRFLLTKPAGTHVTNMTIEDAPHFSAAERAMIIARYPPHEVEARTKGIPALGSGKVYPVTEASISVPRFAIPRHFKRIAGIDFGWEHPSAGVELAIDMDQDITYVVRCHRAKEQTPIMFSANVRGWGLWLPWAWPHDGKSEAGGKYGMQDTKKLAQLYADQGLKMLASHATHDDNKTNGVEPGIMEILDEMQSGKFKVFDDLNDWWEEFRLYHRKAGKLVMMNDDLMSAMRYAWMMRRFAATPPRAQQDKRAKQRNWRTI